jgi:hypothetical protein
MRVHEIHDINYNGRLLTERTRDGHDDIGVVDIGVYLQLLLPTECLYLLG